MRDVYRITGNHYPSIITLFRSGSLGRCELTSVLLLSMTLAKRIAKMFAKALRSLQKLQVMSVVLGADPVFCFPLLLKLHGFLAPSRSGITPHSTRKQGQGFHPVPSQRMYCTAPSIWQQSRNLSGVLCCRDVGAGEPWANGGCCQISQSPSGADVLHPFL